MTDQELSVLIKKADLRPSDIVSAGVQAGVVVSRSTASQLLRFYERGNNLSGVSKILLFMLAAKKLAKNQTIVKEGSELFSKPETPEECYALDVVSNTQPTKSKATELLVRSYNAGLSVSKQDTGPVNIDYTWAEVGWQLDKTGVWIYKPFDCRVGAAEAREWKLLSGNIYAMALVISPLLLQNACVTIKDDCYAGFGFTYYIKCKGECFKIDILEAQGDHTFFLPGKVNNLASINTNYRTGTVNLTHILPNE